MMTAWSRQDYREMQPGVFQRVLRHGEKLMLCEVRLCKDAIVAAHAHPHEQISYVVSGQVEFIVDGVKKLLGPGDSCLMSSDATHSVTCLQEALILDLFTPLREDFLA